jgi:hypothetical protein
MNMQDNNKQPGGEAMTEANTTKKRPVLLVVTHMPTGVKKAYFYENFAMTNENIHGLVTRFIKEDETGSVRRHPLDRYDDMHVRIHTLYDEVAVDIYDDEMEEDFA